jgi:hypothetical protein
MPALGRGCRLAWKWRLSAPGACRQPRPVGLDQGRPGAGEGNRTLVCSLGSCRSTIELHPPIKHLTRLVFSSDCVAGATNPRKAGQYVPASPGLDQDRRSCRLPRRRRLLSARYWIRGASGKYFNIRYVLSLLPIWIRSPQRSVMPFAMPKTIASSYGSIDASPGSDHDLVLISCLRMTGAHMSYISTARRRSLYYGSIIK